MGEVRAGAAGDRSDGPPSPEGVGTLDELAARLRDLRAWAGNPSFTRLVKDVAAVRAARGLPREECPGRVTVYECFRSGRRRIDVELLVDIVAALGVGHAGRDAWRRAHRAVSTPAAHALRPVPPEVTALLDAPRRAGRHRVANLIGPAGTGRSAVLAALPAGTVRVDLAADGAGDVLHAALDDARGLVVVDNADAPAALAEVGAALGRYRRARAVVASSQPLSGSPGTPASLLPEIAVVSVVAAQARRPHARPPAELPPDIGEFTGRARELAELTDALGSPGTARAVVVRIICGMGGTGKTALAVHAAHRLASAYPDGQLFADLTDATAGEVLAQFLTELGVDRSVVPDGPNERTAMYRSRTAGRRVLVVLDNATSEEVVRPLVPGTASCGVLVTSRSRLSTLSGAGRLDLGQLPGTDALSLLRTVAAVHPRGGHDGGDAGDDESARAVVDLCDRLPLAIRIAGARIAHRRDVPIARFADRLADEKARLDILSTPDIGVRACFDVTYADLGAHARHAFLYFGLLTMDNVASWVLRVATGLPQQDVELAIDELADAQLFTAAGTDLTGEPRYRMHDLVRLYAAERAQADLGEDQRQAGLRRVFESWLALALAADHRLPYRTLPGPDHAGAAALPSAGLLADPLAWFESERDQLRAVVLQACGSGRPDLAWRLADACAGFYEARDHYDDWRETHLACLDACEPVSTGAFTMARNLAYQYSLPVVRGETMTAYAARALDISRAAGLEHGTAQAQVLLAVAAIARAAFDEAFDLVAAARDHAEPGSTVDLAALSVLGVLHRLRGDEDAAAEHFTRLLDRGTGRRHHGYELVAMRTLAIIWRAKGRYAEAAAILEKGVTLTRHVGVRASELLMLIELGEVSALAGSPTADDELAAANQLAENMSSEIGAALAWRAMSTLDIARGDLDRALDRLTRSLAVQRHHGIPHVEAHTLRALGTVHARLRDPAAATRAWQQARAIYSVLGNDNELDAIDRDLAALGGGTAPERP